VTVVEAYDVVFEPGCPQGGQRALQFELEVAVETADGALQGTFRHRVGTRPSSAPQIWTPVDRFEQVTGIKGVDYASAEYARIEFYNILDLAAHSVTGSLAVLTWENVYEQQASHPRLTW
jgi:hypothetical protein